MAKVLNDNIEGSFYVDDFHHMANVLNDNIHGSLYVDDFNC